LIIISPSIMGVDAKAIIHGIPLFPLKNPGIVSIPLGFLGAIIGTLAARTGRSPARKRPSYQYSAGGPTTAEGVV